MSSDDENKILERRLKRAKKAQAEAETLLEEKSRELYRANQELLKLNSGLEELVQQRTLELEKERDKAITASQAKSQFLANMSHEIRTPLNGMLGFAHLLQKTDLNDKQLGHLRTVINSGDLLLEIINDILEFSRIEAGHLSIVDKNFDIRNCVEELVEILALKAFEKGLEVSVSVSGDIADEIRCDEGRLRQVFVNLIGNAIKFTHFGEIAVRVSLVDEKLLCEVIDTGVGIPEKKQKTIFGAFAQTDESDTRKYGGTGLGLTISKKIVEAMGGTIEVESSNNQGSRFFFYIPYIPVSEGQKIQTSIDSKAAVFFQNGTIRSNLAHRFKSWGVQTTIFNSLSIESLKSLDSCTHILIDENLIPACRTLPPEILKEALSGKSVAVATINGEDEPKWQNMNLKMIKLPKPLRRKQLRRWLEGQLEEKESSPNADSKKDGAATKENIASEHKILLVEDNLINQQLAIAVLESGGYEYEVANNGQEAVDLFAKNSSFSAILMDCQMPIMDGFDATKAIREQNADVPIIAMTANAFRKTQKQCFDAGMNDFLTKPFKEDQFFECLKKHISAA